MKRIKLLFSVGLLIFSIASCDKIDTPLEKKTTTTVINNPIDTTKKYDNYSDTISPTIRKILIEDFTGHTCGYCPEAAVIAEQLKKDYGKKILVASVHSGGFAIPQNNTDGSYKTDFRTAAGNEYDLAPPQGFGVSAAGNPNGFVNRSLIINNTLIIKHTSWGAAVEKLKSLLPDAKMEIGINYDKSTRNLKTMVKTKVLNSLNGKYSLVIYLIQDSIVDWQKDYSKSPEKVKDYLHRDVLRDAITNEWGDILITTSAATGKIFTKNYDYRQINSKWDVSHCSLIAYIRNTTTEEIIQAEEVHIIK